MAKKTDTEAEPVKEAAKAEFTVIDTNGKKLRTFEDREKAEHYASVVLGKIV